MVSEQNKPDPKSPQALSKREEMDQLLEKAGFKRGQKTGAIIIGVSENQKKAMLKSEAQKKG